MTTGTAVIDPIVRDMIASDPSVATFGWRVLSAHAGEAVLEGIMTPAFANGYGVGHGAFTFALADTAFAMAANTVLPNSATADATVLLLAPTRVGDVLTARAVVRHHSRRQSVVDVTVRVGDQVVAELRCRGVVLRAT